MDNLIEGQKRNGGNNFSNKCHLKKIRLTNVESHERKRKQHHHQSFTILISDRCACISWLPYLIVYCKHVFPSNRYLFVCTLWRRIVVDNVSCQHLKPGEKLLTMNYWLKAIFLRQNKCYKGSNFYLRLILLLNKGYRYLIIKKINKIIKNYSKRKIICNKFCWYKIKIYIFKLNIVISKNVRIILINNV